MPALIAIGLFAAGCGSDNSGSSSGATTTAASGGATTTAAAGGATTTAAGGATTTGAATTAAATSAVANKDPISIALLGIESGPNATDNRHNALDLAVEEINAKGGMMGHPVKYTAYDAGQTPDQASTALQKALSDKPTVIIGLPVTAQVQATAPLLGQSGIPVIHSAQSPNVGFSKLNVPNLYRMNVAADKQTDAMVKYVTETAKPKKVGLIYSTDTNSTESGKRIESALTAAGVEVVSRTVAPTATDTTEAVLAFKDVDATISWTFPAVNSVFMKQRAQNGLTAPHFMDTGGSTVVGLGLATGDELKGLSYVAQCDADVLTGPQVDAFKQAYQKKFGKLDFAASNPTNYDTVYFIDAMVKKANGSIAAKDLDTAMGTTNYTGVCGDLKTNADHDLMTTMYVVDASGGPTSKKLAATYKNS
jgi:branched-chain amino acid transport system substrate-binding protein